MKIQRERFHSLKDLPREEFLTPGSSMCGGCGGLETLRLMHKVLGGNLVIVNAAGCLSLLATFPHTPLRSSWLYTSMAGAPAGAQGVRDALDILIEKGRLPPEENLKVLVLAGDGATYDMGLSSTSAAIHRRLDFWYLCYDNEAYGNTGFQTSAASPFGSRTATSALGTNQSKKDIFEIWRAHRPPYVATVSTHDPIDLAEKVERAAKKAGPKLFLAFAACPTGWGFDPGLSDTIAKLAIDTGIWPLKEAVDGKVRHTFIPNRLRPVEEYLKPQRRFRHLFWPSRRDDLLKEIQAAVDVYWVEVHTNTAPCRTAAS